MHLRRKTAVRRMLNVSRVILIPLSHATKLIRPSFDQYWSIIPIPCYTGFSVLFTVLDHSRVCHSQKAFKHMFHLLLPESFHYFSLCQLFSQRPTFTPFSENLFSLAHSLHIPVMAYIQRSQFDFWTKRFGLSHAILAWVQHIFSPLLGPLYLLLQ